MNRLLPSGLSLPYAETHYKFKRPWSPLYRRWPEIFIDGPSFCVPGISPVFYLVVKDGDLFPIRIRDLLMMSTGHASFTRARSGGNSSNGGRQTSI